MRRRHGVKIFLDPVASEARAGAARELALQAGGQRGGGWWWWWWWWRIPGRIRKGSCRSLVRTPATMLARPPPCLHARHLRRRGSPCPPQVLADPSRAAALDPLDSLTCLVAPHEMGHAAYSLAHLLEVGVRGDQGGV